MKGLVTALLTALFAGLMTAPLTRRATWPSVTS
jgi:hypothetical protein